MNTFSATVRSGNSRGSWWTTAMPSGAGLGRPVDLDRLPVEPDRAAVGLVDPGEDLDQRALARPVLADEGMDLARDEVERDVVERLGRGEPLGDPAQLGARRGGDDGRLLGHRHAVAAVSP